MSREFLNGLKKENQLVKNKQTLNALAILYSDVLRRGEWFGVGRARRLFLLMVAGMILLGCLGEPEVIPLTAKESADVIEAAIRDQVGKLEGELTKEDLEKVTALYIKRRRLSNMTGLERLGKLQVLGLNDNSLTDVSALAGLADLEILYLHNNKITNVNALAGLKRLRQIYLYGNSLTDVSGLAALTQLETLYLHNNPGLSKAQIDGLQGVLTKCKIKHTAIE